MLKKPLISLIVLSLLSISACTTVNTHHAQGVSTNTTDKTMWGDYRNAFKENPFPITITK